MQEEPFGDLLKILRKQQHLSQQALADKLGVHRNTIWSWEQGVYLPDSRGMVLELARQLDLDEPETRQLLEASLTRVSSYWNVPFARNPFFRGRVQVLEQLRTALVQASPVVALTQSSHLHGLGGAGKTQVAVEYAYRYRADYEVVLWVQAQSETTLFASFMSLANLLSLPEQAEEDRRKVVTEVLRWLNRHQGWLLIFDQVEDPALLKSFLPASGQGTVLLTTRLSSLGSLAQTIELPPMTTEERIDVLLARAKRQQRDEEHPTLDPCEEAAARLIVAALGEWPLALDQAGTYIDSCGCSLAEYVRFFQPSQLHLLDGHRAGSDYALAVAQAFALVSEKLERDDSSSAERLPSTHERPGKLSESRPSPSLRARYLLLACFLCCCVILGVAFAKGALLIPASQPPYNNVGITDQQTFTSGNFDGQGNSYAAAALASGGLQPGAHLTIGTISYTWPDVPAGQADNYEAYGQTLFVPRTPGATSVGFLGSATNSNASGLTTLHFTDGTTRSFLLAFSDWTLDWSLTTGRSMEQPVPGNTIARAMGYRDVAHYGITSLRPVYLFTTQQAIPAGKTLQSVTLPQPLQISGGQIHLFAIGLNGPA